MRLVLIALISLAACTRYVQAPPAVPIAHVEPAIEAKPAPAAPTKTLIERFTALAPPLGHCEQWGADSMLCHPSPTEALWCVAPADGSHPHCEMSLDWTQPTPPQEKQAETKHDDKAKKPPEKK